MTEAFNLKGIPRSAKSAYDKVKAVVKIQKGKGSGASYFSYRDSVGDYGAITFTEKNRMLLKYPEIIVRHEFGHAIDFDGRGVLRSSERSFIATVKEANKSVQPGAPIYDDVVAYVKKHRRDPSLSDFFSALTKNRIKGTFGHPSSYYRNYRVRASEMFANTFDMYCRESIMIGLTRNSLSSLRGFNEF